MGTDAAHAAPAGLASQEPLTGWRLAAGEGDMIGDPEADDVAAYLNTTGQVDLANQVFHEWTRNGQPLPPQAPAKLAEFLTRNAALSPDEQEVVAGFRSGRLRDFVQTNMEALTFAEGVGLFTALADPLLAKSVWHNQFDLVMEVGRRFSRTLNTLWDGLGSDNWGPEGNNLAVLSKLRLVHAAARQRALAYGWNIDRDGWPISQRLCVEELMFVGYNNMPLARKAGIDVSDQISSEMVTLCSLAGRLLGIDQTYIPRNIEQSEQILADSRAHHRAPSADGIKLAHGMLDWMEHKFPGGGEILAAVVRNLEPQVADILEIRANPFVDRPVGLLMPLLFAGENDVQKWFPLLVPIHKRMFRVASTLVAWYAVDFRDFDLQLPPAPARP